MILSYCLAFNIISSDYNSLKEKLNEDDTVDSFHNNIGEWANYLEIHNVFQVRSVCGFCAVQYINCMMEASIIIDVNTENISLRSFQND